MDQRRQLKPLRGQSEETAVAYREVSRSLQRQLRQDKENWIQDKCKEAEEGLIRNDTRTTYKTIKQLSNTFKPLQRNVLDKDNRKELDQLGDILHRWREYGESLFKSNDAGDRSIANTGNPLKILKSEVRRAIKRLPNNKAPGTDAIQAELIKAGGEPIVDFFTTLCNKVITENKWPKEWTQTVFIPIPKVSGAKRCDEHRTISLINHSSKILLRILLTRMQPQAEEEINETQMGFRTGVGTRDQIFNLRIIAEKARENNIKLHLAFIDYSKAFDSVQHSKLWKILEEMNTDNSNISVIKALYLDQQACVRVEQELTEWFNVEKGVRQGCLLSPMCFNLYTEYIMRSSADMSEEGIKVNGRILNNLRYADDIVLMAKSEEGLQAILSAVNTVSKSHGLFMNVKKTKTMLISKNHEVQNISCDGKEVQQVSQFKYLGAIITEEADCKTEVNSRLGQGRGVIKKLTKIWKSRSISVKSKLRIMKALVWPVATYGSESWTIRKREAKKIEAFEMYAYRRVLRISWRERRTNQSILQELDTTLSLLKDIRIRKLRYFGHVTRRNNLSTEILQGKFEGTRSQGRQRTRWTDNIKDWIGSGINECSRMAHDRLEWRSKVRAATRIANPQS